MKLNRTMKLILAVLEVTGPQSTFNIIRIVYAGQTGFFKKQEEYVSRCLTKLADVGLIKYGWGRFHEKAWIITEKGRQAQ